MNIFRRIILAMVSLVTLTTASSFAYATSAAGPDGSPQLLTELTFSAAAAMTSSSLTPSLVSAPGWAIGAQKGGEIGVQQTASPRNNGANVYALVGNYPNPPSGGQYMWASYNVANLNTEDVYIEFWAKMPSEYKGGCKFVKVFGQRSSTGYGADTTIATNYTGGDFGAINQISFGDGTGLGNDSQNVINLSGSYPQWIGRSYGTAVVSTPQMHAFSSADWGDTWHHFRIHIKFNSGTTSQNEIPNGEYYLEIDGKVYVDATNLYNRNPLDGPIQSIEFFGWAQTEPQPFQIWYDDIRISTGGFISQALPNPPTNLIAH